MQTSTKKMVESKTTNLDETTGRVTVETTNSIEGQYQREPKRTQQLKQIYFQQRNQ